MQKITILLNIVLALLVTTNKSFAYTDLPKEKGLINNALLIAEKSINDPCAVWSSAWKHEYLDTLKTAMSKEPNEFDYDKKIKIFIDTFPEYIENYKKSKFTQVEFDMCKAEVQWYCETLLADELPSATEKELLKSQIQTICDYASEHLKGQFPFLTETYIQEGKKAAILELNHQLENSLIPFFRRPFSQDQIKVIQANWASLYKRWYSIWRDIRFSSWDNEEILNSNDIAKNPQTQFVQKCMSFLPVAIWPTVQKPPKYFLEALNKLNVEKNIEIDKNRQLEKIGREITTKYKNQVEQIEQWSFIFSALLETSILNENKNSLSSSPEKEGDAYELKR
jgi:hypothetical protein